MKKKSNRLKLTKIVIVLIILCIVVIFFRQRDNYSYQDEARLMQNIAINAKYCYINDNTVEIYKPSIAFESTITETIRSVELLMDLLQIPGISVTLVDAEKGFTWYKGFGYANTLTEVPMGPNILFPLGSISKTFTAIGVLQVIEMGLIDLDEPIITYLPNFSMLPEPLTGSNYINITPRMLLAHASGLASYEGPYVITIDNPSKNAMNNFLYNVAELHMLAAEGTVFQYSNDNFTLLGILIAALIGDQENLYKDFKLHMLEAVFTPLGMTSTGFQMMENMYFAYPYQKKYIEGDMIFFNNLPSGGMISNAYDMAQFMHILLSNDVTLSANIREQMFQVQSFNFANAPDIMFNMRPTLGMIQSTEFNGFRHYGHGGTFVYYHAFFAVCPKTSLGVFVAANSASAAGIPGYIAPRILVYAIMEKMGELILPDIDIGHPTNRERDALYVYEGFYEIIGQTHIIKVALGEDDNLWMHHFYEFSSEPFALVPLTNGSFGLIINDWVHWQFWFDDDMLYLGTSLKTRHIGRRVSKKTKDRMMAIPELGRWSGIYYPLLKARQSSLIPSITVGVDMYGFGYIDVLNFFGGSRRTHLVHLEDLSFWGNINFHKNEGKRKLEISGLLFTSTPKSLKLRIK